MSRRRDPVPVKKSSPLSGTTIGSLYGEEIGVKPGVFIGLPILNTTILQKPKLSVPTGVQVNQTTKQFGVELMQSSVGQDQAALNLRTPMGYKDLSDRVLIRISVWWMRIPSDREKVLQYVIDKVIPNIDPEIRKQYEDEVPEIVQNQNCGSGWSSSAHYFLIGKKGVEPPPINFSNAGEYIFGVKQGNKFEFDEGEWMWSPDTTLVSNYQHQKLNITLVGTKAMASTREGAERAVKQFAEAYALDVRYIAVDQHSGLPFGRPGLHHRQDLSEESRSVHEFSTGGKDYVCYRERIAVLIDDSSHNLAPARSCEIATRCCNNRLEPSFDKTVIGIHRVKRFAGIADDDKDFFHGSKLPVSR